MLPPLYGAHYFYMYLHFIVYLGRALDCGAGIGRVSRDVLSKLALKVLSLVL
ncbi:hypothetical protein T492DRAFT_992352, partial [Pavlovales sp. CCMP2436]